MSKRTHLWNVSLFLTAIAVLAALNLVKPGSAEQVSELEQRELQRWPSFSADKLALGHLFKEYDNYFSDRFVYRSTFVELGSKAKSLTGIKDDDGVSLVVRKPGGDVGTGVQSASASGQGEVVSAEASKYLVVGDRAMLLYQYSPKSAEAYAAAIRHARERIDPKVNVYAMLVPSHVEFVEDEDLRKLSGSQKAAYDHVYSLLGPNIKSVPAYDNVKAHMDKGEYLYFRTDHHWTSTGAYYGYEALAKTMGLAPVPLAKYEVKELPGYLGTSYAATLNEKLKANPDTITTYVPFVKHDYQVFKDGVHGKKRTLVESRIPKDGRGGYAVFLGGDFAVSRITTETANGKKLLIVKDSYANAVVPFLLPHFQEIELVDPRYFKGNIAAEAKKRGVTDVLFINGAVVTTYTGIAKLIETSLAAPAN